MRVAITWLLFAISFSVFGQSNWSLGGTYYHGAMFKYLKEQPWLIFSGLNGIEIKAVKNTRGSRPWEYYHNFPKLKVGLTAIDYGDPEHFGQLYATTVGMNYGFWGSKKLKWAPAFGLGYSTRYNTPNNRVNRAVSTKISFIAELDLVYEWKMSQNLVNQLLLSFRHGSNGNIKKPNYGMNFVMLGLNVNFDRHDKEYDYKEYENHKDLRKLRYYLIYSTGWKDPSVFRDNPLYQVQSISLFAAYRFSNINSFVAGLDGFIDTSQYHEYINQTEETPPFDENDFDKRQLAFTFGNIFHFGRLGIISQAGLFLYRPYDFMKFSYQRYGFQYTIADHIIVHSALKAYFGSADVVEFGLGFRL